MMNATDPLKTMPYQHLTVVGAGLIGGSFILAARQTCPSLHIRAVDTDEATLQYLLKASVVDAVSRELPAEWPPNHLVVLATHLDSNIALLEQLAPRIKHDPTVTVTDIGSCKQAVCQAGTALLPTQFIGGHPLAGREVSGVQHATGLLFAGKPYVLCGDSNAENVVALKTFIETTLKAHIGFQTPAHHDWAMAYVSHLPQLYAVLLTNLLAEHRPGELLGFHGAGMDGQLRLAASPYAMWQPIFSHNRQHLKEAIRGCRELLDEAETMLTAPTGQGEAWFGAAFDKANTIHREFHAVRQQDHPLVVDDGLSTTVDDPTAG